MQKCLYKGLCPKLSTNDMMRKALVYVTSNWKDLIKYRNDGRFTIDNMLAERAVRPFTVKRKNSLFFSSEDGIESALKYHTLIETCKNVGLNVKEYFILFMYLANL